MAQNLAAFDLSLGTIAGARLEALFEAVPLAVAVFDPELRMLTANARYRELTGVDAAAAVRISIYDAFPNALADLTEQIDSALRGEMPPGPVSIPFQQRDRRRLIETTFVPLTDESGGRGLLFAGNDVTEREELRETLSRNVAQLESIFDVIPDSVRVFDSEGRTVRSNTQALLDYASVDPPTLRELWQRDRPRTTDGTSLFMHEHPTARALRGERVRGETLSVRRGPDGSEQIIEVNSNPLYDEHGKIRGAVTVERDVTIKTQLAKALEEEARRTAQLYERVSTEAERLEKMVQTRTAEVLALQEARARERRLAAVGQLAAGVMHDVNNALNPIMAASYLLETNAENPVAVRDYAVRIAKAAETGEPGLSVGAFIAFNSAYGLFLGAMQALGDASLNLLRIIPIYERIIPILDTAPEVDRSKGFPGRLTGAIDISHVTFRYTQDGPAIVRDLSLKIKAGEFVAFVGSSGCGKSTLMRLMLGFEAPASGTIYFDGQDLSSIDVRLLRQQMGVVLQVSRVMPTEIFRNICGASARTLEDAWEAAEKSGLAEDIRNMPMGMHTYVSEGGGTLSGGQRQRLMIARAIVNKPKIIFLDEATSALDNRTQQIVSESMDRMEATRIVIAHRLSTIINADKICYTEGGKIIEMGNYDELMKLDGLFAALAKRQVA